MPNLFTVRYDEIRTTNINIFPYLIHYRTDDLKKTIVIHAVFHTSRNPNIWKERK